MAAVPAAGLRQTLPQRSSSGVLKGAGVTTAVPDYFRVITGQGNHRRSLIGAVTAINDQINTSFKQVADFVWVAHRLGFSGHDQTDTQHGLTQLLQQCLGNWIGWYAQPDSASFRVHQHARHFTRGIQNESIRPRDMRSEERRVGKECRTWLVE